METGVVTTASPGDRSASSWILGKEPEVMGWGTTEVDLEPYLPSNGRIVSVDGAGHFVHIERPQEVSEMALEFLS